LALRSKRRTHGDNGPTEENSNWSQSPRAKKQPSRLISHGGKAVLEKLDNLDGDASLYEVVAQITSFHEVSVPLRSLERIVAPPLRVEDGFR
jgi:hypothetical protein